MSILQHQMNCKKDLDNLANSLTKVTVDSELHENKCSTDLFDIAMLNVNLSLKKDVSMNSPSSALKSTDFKK